MVAWLSGAEPRKKKIRLSILRVCALRMPGVPRTLRGRPASVIPTGGIPITMRAARDLWRAWAVRPVTTLSNMH
jgi:hypothetical protein